MDADRIFAVATAMRRELADQLDGLDSAQLSQPSMCAGWDVLTVAAHLAVSVTVPLPSLMAAVIRHGGSMHRANDRLARQLARQPEAAVIELLRENADRQLASPRNGPVAPLTELLVHAGDIRRALDIPYGFPADVAVEALDFLTTVRPTALVGRGRLAGIAVVADDVTFQSEGGAVVHGRIADLVMAVCGRAGVLPDLRGPGLETLRARLT